MSVLCLFIFCRLKNVRRCAGVDVDSHRQTQKEKESERRHTHTHTRGAKDKHRNIKDDRKEIEQMKKLKKTKTAIVV